jgi:hypothetical protein
MRRKRPQNRWRLGLAERVVHQEILKIEDRSDYVYENKDMSDN